MCLQNKYDHIISRDFFVNSQQLLEDAVENWKVRIGGCKTFPLNHTIRFFDKWLRCDSLDVIPYRPKINFYYLDNFNIS